MKLVSVVLLQQFVQVSGEEGFLKATLPTTAMVPGIMKLSYKPRPGIVYL
jgi:hypothetical protein